MGYTKTEIANQALLLLGEESVSNVDTDTGNPAKKINKLWNTITKEIQSSFTWQERTRVVEISAHPDESYDGLYKYPLPNDFLRMVKVEPNYASGSVDYRIEGNYIVCEQITPIEIEYIAWDYNPGSWSPQLAKATYYTLAARLAMPLTQNVQLFQKLDDDARRILDNARWQQSKDKRGPYKSYRGRLSTWEEKKAL